MSNNELGLQPGPRDAPAQSGAVRKLGWQAGLRLRIGGALAVLFTLALSYWAWSSVSPEGHGRSSEETELNGWSYRWGDSPRLASGEFLWAQPGLSAPPWRATDRLSPLLPGRHGESEVWLRTRLPGLAQGDASLYIPWVFQSFQIYLDGKLTYEFGDLRTLAAKPLGAGGERRHLVGSKAHFIPLGDHAGGKWLSVRIHSDRRLIGLAGKPLFGEPQTLMGKSLRQELDRLVIGALFVLLGLAVLTLYVLRREELGYLYYGCFAISAASLVISESALRMLLVDAPVGWIYIRYLTMYVIPIFLTGYIEQISGRGPFGMTRWLRLLHTAYLVQAVLRMVLFRVDPYDAGNGFFILAATFTLLYLMVIMARSAWRGDVEAKVFSVGFAISVSFLLHETMMSLGIYQQVTVPISHYGFACLTFSLGLVSARRYLLLHTRLRNFATVMQLSLSSAQVMEPGDQARAALDALVNMLGAQQALLFQIDEETNELALHAMHDGSGEDGGVGLQFATEVAEKVRVQRRPLLLQLATTDPSHPCSVMVGPLLVRDQLLGVVYLAADQTRAPFRDYDQEILLNVSGQIAGALLSSRAIQLEFANALSTRRIQEQEALLTAAGRMAKGDLASPIAVPANSELAELADALDGVRQDIATRIKLLDSTQEALQQQVTALQDSHREVDQLNEELRRQIEQRSRRLLELLVPAEGSTAARKLEPGNMLGGRYRVLRLIGEGGMGMVYEVERSTDSRRLAAKILSAAPSRTVLGRFAREAQILSRLDHRNLISIIDIDITSSGVLYIIMELVNGGSLWEHRARFGQINWVLNVLQQLAQALAALHAQGIVHRDLKPENVLIVQPTPEAIPTVKLTDFGISILLEDSGEHPAPPRPPTALESAQTPALRVAFGPTPEVLALREREVAITVEAPPAPRSASVPVPVPAKLGTPVTQEVLVRPRRPDSRNPPQLTQAGAIIGTPQYMAPELARGSHHAQPSADVFSLGVLAYELLTGELPFSQWPIFSQVGDNRPAIVPLRLRCPELQGELADLFQRCLLTDPAARPTAEELAAWLAAAGIGPRSPSSLFAVPAIPN